MSGPSLIVDGEKLDQNAGEWTLDSVNERRQTNWHKQKEILTGVPTNEKIEGENLTTLENLESEMRRLDKLASGFHRQAEIEEALDKQREAADNGVDRGDGTKVPGITLGETIKLITASGSEKAKHGEIILPGFRTNVDYKTLKREVEAADIPIYDGRQRTGLMHPAGTAYVQDVDMAELIKRFEHLASNPVSSIAGAGGSNTIEGGIPELVMPIVQQMFNMSRIASVCRMYNTPHGNPLKIRRRLRITGTPAANNTVAAATANDGESGVHPGTVRQGAAISLLRPEYRTVTLNAVKFGYMTALTYELTQDLEPTDIENELVDDAGIGMGLELGWRLVNGTGVGSVRYDDDKEFNGIRTALGTVADTAGYRKASGANAGQLRHDASVAGAPVTYAELVDMVHSIADSYMYEPSMAMMTSWFNVGLIRRVVDDENRPIFDMNPQGDFPGRVLGIPIMADAGFPDLHRVPSTSITTNVDHAIVMGAWNRFACRTAGGLRVDRSEHFEFDEDEIVWRFLMRGDSDLLDPAAFTSFSHTSP